MAHFAEIDENNTVLRVLVVDNSLEAEGANFLANTLGLGGTWIQTSYNSNIRKNFAGIGYEYDSYRDAFIAPKPTCHPQTVLFNEEACTWSCSDASHTITIGE
jgi:hypothetical protein